MLLRDSSPPPESRYRADLPRYSLTAGMREAERKGVGQGTGEGGSEGDRIGGERRVEGGRER